MAARQVVFRPQAADDASEGQAWYESRRAGLGHEFGLAVEDLIDRIASNPFMFHRVHGETRRGVLSRFPYAVYFRPAGDGTSPPINARSNHGLQPTAAR